MKSHQPSQMTILTMKEKAHRTVAPMIIPPDGGWGWVIVITGFVSSTVMDGISYCFFLYRDPMVRNLNIVPGDISFLSALFTGFYFIGGILACSAANHYGFRPIMILGASVVLVCLGSGYVLNEIMLFLIIVGIIGGMSAGFVFVAAALPVGFYFDKKRSIAVGMVGSGSGFGAAVMPQATQYFMSKFDWRNTFLFHSGLCLLLVFMGLLIRPLRPVLVVMKQGSRASMFTVLDRSSSPIDMSLFRVAAADTESMGKSSIGRSVLATALQTHPTIEYMVQDMDVISIRVRENTERSLLLKLTEMTQSRILQPSASIVVPSIVVEEEETPAHEHLAWYKCGCCRGRAALPERPLLRTDLYYTGSLTRLDEFTTKDKEVEYHMHVTKLPTYFEAMQDLTRKYTSWCCRNILHGVGTLLDYKLLKSPTFICLALCGFLNYVAFFLPFLYGKVRLEEMGEEEGKRAVDLITMMGIGTMIGRVSSGLIMSVIPRFGARSVAAFTSLMAGIIVICFRLEEMGEEEGKRAVDLITLMGIGTMIGRVSSGLIMSVIPRFGARSVAAFTSLMAGIIVICCTFYNNLVYQFTMMLLFGAVVGFYAPLRSLIIVDFFGLNMLTPVTGMMILFQGMGSFLGAPLAEAVCKYTKNKNSPYYVCGAALVMASVMLWPMRVLQRWEKKKKERKKP